MDSSPIKKEMTNNVGVLSACKEAFVWPELERSQILWCLGSKKQVSVNSHFLLSFLLLCNFLMTFCFVVFLKKLFIDI